MRDFAPDPPEQAEALRALWRQQPRPDIRQFLAQAGELSATQLAAVLRVDQQEHWRLGERLPVENYLRAYPALEADSEAVLDLIYQEFLLREQRGETPAIQEYQERFPRFAEQLRQQVELYQALNKGHRPGDGTVLGDYVLLEEIGRGGMGHVFKAWHRRMDRHVAVKILPPGAMGSPSAVRRFEREIRACARLVHPNIVRAYDAGEQDGLTFLVMELIDGPNLGRLVREAGPLPPDRAVAYACQAAQGLQYAHEQGIIHRDVKPSNLLAARERGSAAATIKILDLGLASIREEGTPTASDADQTLTRPGALLGTVDYMPPEQARNPRQADHRADIYSLGGTLYFLLTGQPPYPGETPLDKILAHREAPVPCLDRSFPPALNAALQRMLAKAPADRFPSMAAVLTALTQVQLTLTNPSAVPATPVDLEPTKPGPVPGPGPGDGEKLSPVTLSSPPPLAPVDPNARRRNGDRKSLWPLALGGGLALALLIVGILSTGPWWPGQGKIGPPAATSEPAGIGEICCFPGHTDEVRCVAFSPDGAWGLSASDDGTVRLWDIGKRIEFQQFTLREEQGFNSAVFTPQQRAVFAGDDKYPRLWDIQTGGQVRHFDGHKKWVNCVAVSPSGQQGLSGGQDGSVRLWELATGKQIHCLQGHDKAVSAVAFTPAGGHALSGGDDETVCHWDLATGAMLARWAGEACSISSAAFLPDGQRALLGCWDGKVRLWDTKTGRELRGLVGHTESVRSVALSQDGRRAVSASEDGTVRLWDVEQGRALESFPGHKGPVLAVALAPDGRLALSGGEDATVRLWRLPR